MGKIVRYSTPTHRIIARGYDLTGYDNYVTYAQGKNKVTYKSEDVTYDGNDTTILIIFTQEGTAQFKPGKVEYQLNCVGEGDIRVATFSDSIEFDRNLLDEVVPYGAA